MRRTLNIRRALLLPAVGVLLLGVGCGGGSGSEAARIEDPRFVAGASRICAAELPPLRADVADDTPREPADVAPTVEERAESLADLVDELRMVEVEEAARPEVEAWLRDWDRYVDVGRRYAAALRSGDPNRYSSVAEEGSGPQERISAFARTNDMEPCALDGVPLPERESPI